MNGQRAAAGPAGWPAEALDRAVRIEGTRSEGPSAHLRNKEMPVAGVPVQVKQVGEVPRIGPGCELVRVLPVGSRDDLANRRVVCGPIDPYERQCPLLRDDDRKDMICSSCSMDFSAAQRTMAVGRGPVVIATHVGAHAREVGTVDVQ